MFERWPIFYQFLGGWSFRQELFFSRGMLFFLAGREFFFFLFSGAIASTGSGEGVYYFTLCGGIHVRSSRRELHMLSYLFGIDINSLKLSVIQLVQWIQLLESIDNR